MYFLFAINLITQTNKKYRKGRRFKVFRNCALEAVTE